MEGLIIYARLDMPTGGISSPHGYPFQTGEVIIRWDEEVHHVYGPTKRLTGQEGDHFGWTVARRLMQQANLVPENIDLGNPDHLEELVLDFPKLIGLRIHASNPAHDSTWQVIPRK